MCGRYQIDSEDPKKLQKRFNLSATPHVKSNWNVAPSQEMPIIKADNTLEIVKWGLRLHFMPKDLINIRAESSEKAWSHKYLQFQRCLVPASGFYEWKRQGKEKTPFYFHIKKEPLFAFAGVYSESSGYAIITTTPNDIMLDVHNRMPVILEKEDEEKWINPDMTEMDEIKTYLKPYPAKYMEKYPVSTRVNSPSYNDKTLINAG
ncbi:MAG: hypothetical protein RI947_229 [Candidatus Parcubacteria bacterium]|jgi:putative SOS response-associated peptidase YedK